jgi:uncharacterized phage protein (TIGR01671 family)
MSREIKFRAWDKRLLKMTTDCDAMGGVWDSLFGNQDGTDQIIMQYTGLKDKNGVEIYCGDFVANPNDSEPHYVIEWNDEQACFMLGGSCLLKAFRLDEFWSVIGNLHQHPDLLSS